jgi:hypothetical protein
MLYTKHVLSVLSEFVFVLPRRNTHVDDAADFDATNISIGNTTNTGLTDFSTIRRLTEDWIAKHRPPHALPELYRPYASYIVGLTSLLATDETSVESLRNRELLNTETCIRMSVSFVHLNHTQAYYGICTAALLFVASMIQREIERVTYEQRFFLTTALLRFGLIEALATACNPSICSSTVIQNMALQIFEALIRISPHVRTYVLSRPCMQNFDDDDDDEK